VLDSITDALFVLDGKWRFTYLNSEAERVLVSESEDLIGKDLREALPEEVRLPLYQELHRAVEGRSTVDFRQHHPGLGTWLEVRACPFESGIVVSFRETNEQGDGEGSASGDESIARQGSDEATMDLAAAHGVTTRKRDEEAPLMLASIVENSEDAIVGNTLDGIVTSWNPAAERLFGYSAEEMIGESVSILNTPENPESLEQI
jgi:PAS domain S-box-containing protein